MRKPSPWRVGLPSTLPPSGPFSILPNPLHKPLRKKIPLASPIYPHVSLKRSPLNANDDVIVGLDLDSAYVRPWDLALYTDMTINNKEGTGIVTEKEEGIYTMALKAIVTIIIKVTKGRSYCAILIKPVCPFTAITFTLLRSRMLFNKHISHVAIVTLLVTASLQGHTLVEDVYVSADTPPMKTTSVDRYTSIWPLQDHTLSQHLLLTSTFHRLQARTHYQNNVYIESIWVVPVLVVKDMRVLKLSRIPVSPTYPMLYSVAPQPLSGFNKPNLNPHPPSTNPDPDPDPDISLRALATAHREIGGSTVPTP
ncbi:hypothetical protein BDP27DRAFT_1433625 [Rhodocollybia butyracea]|uniref:Uncharacterized protein n=1 Tax=Rhodocollybia butyracea TaxID=206335 RepID=A0A9P5P6T7_9AGAR|nr:hypothetical protein BDP27DRAFT_1433625 [Rhodocollybia butyracea]